MKKMITQVTKGIKISVNTSFEGTFFKNYKMHFAFGYTITIENQSKDSVQLTSRHWQIYDALNDFEILDGEGVIGNTSREIVQAFTNILNGVTDLVDFDFDNTR